MEYAVEMGSGAMIYTPSFIKTVSALKSLMVDGRGYADIQTACCSHKPNILLFENEGSW